MVDKSLKVEAPSKFNSSATKRKGRGFGGETFIDSSAADTIDTDGPAGPAKSIEGWIVCATNINIEAMEEDIHNFFGDCGEITNMNANIDRKTGYLKGYALVEYKTLKEAENAINELNGKEFLNQIVKVDWAYSTGSLDDNKRRKR